MNIFVFLLDLSLTHLKMYSNGYDRQVTKKWQFERFCCCSEGKNIYFYYHNFERGKSQNWSVRVCGHRAPTLLLGSYSLVSSLSPDTNMLRQMSFQLKDGLCMQGKPGLQAKSNCWCLQKLRIAFFKFYWGLF